MVERRIIALMAIRELMLLIRRNRGRFIGASKYMMQIYSNGERGNIKRGDNTVLCAFDLLEDEIRIAPTKEGSPYEFGYDYLHIGTEDSVESISKLPHKNAKELGEVLINFVTILNNAKSGENIQ